jgi:hypothetical protein
MVTVSPSGPPGFYSIQYFVMPQEANVKWFSVASPGPAIFLLHASGAAAEAPRAVLRVADVLDGAGVRPARAVRRRRSPRVAGRPGRGRGAACWGRRSRARCVLFVCAANAQQQPHPARGRCRALSRRFQRSMRAHGRCDCRSAWRGARWPLHPSRRADAGGRSRGRWCRRRAAAGRPQRRERVGCSALAHQLADATRHADPRGGHQQDARGAARTAEHASRPASASARAGHAP